MNNDTAFARTTDPETSHEAAASVMNLTQYRQNVLILLDLFGPLTDEELLQEFANAKYPHSPSGVRTRRAELVRMGKVRWSGLYRIQGNGRRARTWELVR